MASRLLELSIEEFSKKFLEFERMPSAWRIRAKDVKGDRIKRSDTRIKMYPLRAPRVVRLGSDANVKDLLDAAATALSTEIATRGWKLQLHIPKEGGGGGFEQVGGNYALSNLLNMERERQTQVTLDEETDALMFTAVQHVLETHGLATEPESTVPRAYITALIDRYGMAAIKKAMRGL